MVAFYVASFDSIALIGSCYSYHKLGENEVLHKLIELIWRILLILLPIALIFSDSSMSNLQSVSIIATFSIRAVIVLITVSFLKDAKEFFILYNDIQFTLFPAEAADNYKNSFLCRIHFFVLIIDSLKSKLQV